jgi:hypothetical protein
MAKKRTLIIANGKFKIQTGIEQPDGKIKYSTGNGIETGTPGKDLKKVKEFKHKGGGVREKK